MPTVSGRLAAEPLRTARLLLEPLRVEHAREMAAVLADPSLYEHTGGAAPSEAELETRYRRQVGGVSPDGREAWLNWVLRARDTAAAVGIVQATVRDDARGRRAELAWVIGAAHQGAGLATEAASAAMRWLRTRGVSAFDAHIAPGHTASEAVARKLGMEPTRTRHRGEVRWVTPGRNEGPVRRT
jgi:RimJ/RimL family protein N-acetyltransferase